MKVHAADINAVLATKPAFIEVLVESDPLRGFVL
jgi:hypothetical protein